MKRYSLKMETTKDQKPKECPIVVYFWMVGLAILGYLTGRIALSTQPHPYHWLSLLVGALLGIGVGWLWYWWRGDIKF